jgi:hypothetical protein
MGEYSSFTIAMNDAAPDGAPPRRFKGLKMPKPPCPTVPRRGLEAGDSRNKLNFMNPE